MKSRRRNIVSSIVTLLQHWQLKLLNVNQIPKKNFHLLIGVNLAQQYLFPWFQTLLHSKLAQNIFKSETSFENFDIIFFFREKGIPTKSFWKNKFQRYFETNLKALERLKLQMRNFDFLRLLLTPHCFWFCLVCRTVSIREPDVWQYNFKIKFLRMYSHFDVAIANFWQKLFGKKYSRIFREFVRLNYLTDAMLLDHFQETFHLFNKKFNIKFSSFKLLHHISLKILYQTCCAGFSNLTNVANKVHNNIFPSKASFFTSIWMTRKSFKIKLLSKKHHTLLRRDKSLYLKDKQSRTFLSFYQHGILNSSFFIS